MKPEYYNTIYWYGFVIAWIGHTIYVGSMRNGESRFFAMVFGILYAIIWPLLLLYYPVLLCHFLYRKLVESLLHGD